MKIAFYKGTRKGVAGLFNRLVRWWTAGIYSHCEAVFGLPDENGFSLCASSSKMDGGIRFKLININSEKWDVIEVEANEIIAKLWFSERIGAKYDVPGILGFVFKRTEGDKNKYFCSEAVAASLGIHDAWRFDPNSFYALASFGLEKK